MPAPAAATRREARAQPAARACVGLGARSGDRGLGFGTGGRKRGLCLPLRVRDGGGGRLARRSIGVALGTAVFSSIALVCMTIRSDEIGSPLFWLPPALALVSSVAVGLGLFAARYRELLGGS